MLTLLNTTKQELVGHAASPGFALGPLWMPETEASGIYISKTTPEHEIAALDDAVNAASKETIGLLSVTLGEAKAILEFQLAVLNDDTFRNQARKRITSGETAFQAWNAVLANEIELYRLAKDETFRARASDFQDIQTHVSRVLCNQVAQIIPDGAIVLAERLTPAAFIQHDWHNGGVALTGGSAASHVAVLARQFGVPMVTNLGGIIPALNNGDLAMLSVDRQTGRFFVNPSQFEIVAHQPKAARAASPRRLNAAKFGKMGSIMVNLASLRELETINPNAIDGVGLVRTEFLFAKQNLENISVDEETQLEAYRKILDWAGKKPVYIRTLDMGGDKPHPNISHQNPLSKLRGIQLSLSMPDTFRIQIRALLRAAVFGALHVTLPMVAKETDLSETLALFADEAKKLTAANVPHAMPPIGIMVEVPSVASTLERFRDAAHFSIGTNDLIQFTLAKPRDAAGKPTGVDNPAVLALIKNIVSVGKALGKPVSVCGDAASDVISLAFLMEAGAENFSVNPPSHALVTDSIYDHELNREV